MSARRIFPISEWAHAQEAILLGDAPESSTSSSTAAFHQTTTPEPNTPPTPAALNKNRSRSKSHNWLLGRRPRSILGLPLNSDGVPVPSDTERSPGQQELLVPEMDGPAVSHGHVSGNGHSNGHGNEPEHDRSHRHRYSLSTSAAAGLTSRAGREGEDGKLKGILRRASVSFRSMVHHPSRQASTTTRPPVNDVFKDATAAPVRPQTSYATWHRRLRQVASFRHPPSSYHNEAEANAADIHVPPRDDDLSYLPLPLPLPGSGNEPPVIPHHTGAAAKAAAAAQNESLGLSRQKSGGSQPLQNKWLMTSSSSEDPTSDRESGVGIIVANAGSEADLLINDGTLEQDTNISRVDFVSRLPVELSIQVFAYLDAASLGRSSRVSHGWHNVVKNQHIWHEAFLRTKTFTFATGSRVQPGHGQGVPANHPNVDWKQVYRVKEELDLNWREGRAKPIYLHGHLDSIYCLQFDESKIITGSRDKTIRVWDMRTLQCRLVIGPPDVIDNPSLLVDGSGQPVHFASLPGDVRAGVSMPSLVSFPLYHQASILCLQYDEDILVTGSSDGSCIVYSVASGYRPIRRLQCHGAAVLDLAFDDRHIVTCSKDWTICVWNRETGALLRQLRGHTGPVNAVQLRGNTIVSCSGDFRVKLWNVDTGKNIREFVGHTKGLACSQFTEDGRFVASAGNDKAIRIWDANTGECVRRIKAHDSLVRSLHVDSASGRLISGSYDTDIKVFDMQTGRQLLDFPKWHASWVLSAKSDYRRIVSTGQDPKILIMDFGGDIRGIGRLESARPVDVQGAYI